VCYTELCLLYETENNDIQRDWKNHKNCSTKCTVRYTTNALHRIRFDVEKKTTYQDRLYYWSVFDGWCLGVLAVTSRCPSTRTGESSASRFHPLHLGPRTRSGRAEKQIKNRKHLLAKRLGWIDMYPRWIAVVKFLQKCIVWGVGMQQFFAGRRSLETAQTFELTYGPRARCWGRLVAGQSPATSAGQVQQKHGVLFERHV